MFCKHKWKILSETTTQSRFGQYADLTDRVPNPRNLWELEEGTRKKLIQLVKLVVNLKNWWRTSDEYI
jgi:hypothetical protein